MKDFKVIVYDKERKKRFEEVFGTNSVYVKSPFSKLIRIPSGETKLAYFLDFQYVNEKQRERLVVLLAERFDLTEEYVNKKLEQIGLPILKENTGLWVSHPGR
jgi:hypothetical protein